MTEPAARWLLLAYRVPSEPSSNRVAVWRRLKRLGAYYPQQAVCLLPARSETVEALGEMRVQIDEMGGSATYLEIPSLPRDQDQALMAAFGELASAEYAEIIEECDTTFAREVEFERFRENFTFEEAEEIRHGLEKIERWFGEVVQRDWFGSPARGEADQRIKHCRVLLEEFEQEVYERTGGSDTA